MTTFFPTFYHSVWVHRMRHYCWNRVLARDCPVFALIKWSLRQCNLFTSCHIAVPSTYPHLATLQCQVPTHILPCCSAKYHGHRHCRCHCRRRTSHHATSNVKQRDVTVLVSRGNASKDTVYDPQYSMRRNISTFVYVEVLQQNFKKMAIPRLFSFLVSSFQFYSQLFVVNARQLPH